MTTKREVLIGKLADTDYEITSADRLSIIVYLQVRAGHNIESWRADQSQGGVDV